MTARFWLSAFPHQLRHVPFLARDPSEHSGQRRPPPPRRAQETKARRDASFVRRVSQVWPLPFAALLCSTHPAPPRLKLRCDRAIPCGSCVKRGCAAICPDGVQSLPCSCMPPLTRLLCKAHCRPAREIGIRLFLLFISQSTHVLLVPHALFLQAPRIFMTKSMSSQTASANSRMVSAFHIPNTLKTHILSSQKIYSVLRRRFNERDWVRVQAIPVAT
jgi:hypothetical protein